MRNRFEACGQIRMLVWTRMTYRLQLEVQMEVSAGSCVQGSVVHGIKYLRMRSFPYFDLGLRTTSGDREVVRLKTKQNKTKYSPKQEIPKPREDGISRSF